MSAFREQLDAYVKQKYGVMSELLPFSHEDYSIYRHTRPVLHDQRLLRNGNVPHPARDGHIRTTGLPLVRDEVAVGSDSGRRLCFDEKIWRRNDLSGRYFRNRQSSGHGSGMPRYLKYSWPQSLMAVTIGTRVLPRSVRRYSVLGGTTG